MHTDTTPMSKSTGHIIHNQNNQAFIIQVVENVPKLNPMYIFMTNLSFETNCVIYRYQLLFPDFGIVISILNRNGKFRNCPEFRESHLYRKSVCGVSVFRCKKTKSGEWTQIESNLFARDDKLIEGNKLCSLHMGPSSH